LGDHLRSRTLERPPARLFPGCCRLVDRRELGHRRRVRALDRGLELLGRHVRDAQRRLSLVVGHPGIGRGLGPSQTRGGVPPSFLRRSPTRCRLNRLQELSATARRARLDAVAHPAQIVVLGLPSVRGRRAHLKRRRENDSRPVDTLSPREHVPKPHGGPAALRSNARPQGSRPRGSTELPNGPAADEASWGSVFIENCES